MSDFELMFQLFALLLGLAMAELLGGLARCWHMKAGAVRRGKTPIRLGRLTPLFGLVVLFDLTRFWVTIYAMRQHLTFDYASLLGMTLIIGGYFTISTFVFPDDPDEWPDYDDYFLRANRTVVGGMIIVNLTVLAYGAVLFAQGAPFEDAPMARSWPSIFAFLLYLPTLVLLWFAKSKRTNFALLVFLIVLLLIAAFGPRLF